MILIRSVSRWRFTRVLDFGFKSALMNRCIKLLKILAFLPTIRWIVLDFASAFPPRIEQPLRCELIGAEVHFLASWHVDHRVQYVICGTHWAHDTPQPPLFILLIFSRRANWIRLHRALLGHSMSLTGLHFFSVRALVVTHISDISELIGLKYPKTNKKLVHFMYGLSCIFTGFDNTNNWLCSLISTSFFYTSDCNTSIDWIRDM